MSNFLVEVVVQETDLSDPVSAVFFGVAIFEIIICLILMVAFIKYFDEPIIRRSTPWITVMILFGVTCLATTQMIFSITTTDATCTISSILYHLGMSILLTGLAVRNYRIYIIFSNKKARSVNISESKLLLVMALITGTYMLFIIVIFCIFGFKANVVQSSQSIYYKYLDCGVPNSTMDTIFTIFTQVFIGIMILINLLLAWLTRKVKADFRETNPLVAISVIIGAAYIIFIPLGATLKNQVNSESFKYAINVELLTIIIIGSLVILFIPKIVQIQKKKRKDKQRQSRVLNNDRISS